MAALVSLSRGLKPGPPAQLSSLSVPATRRRRHRQAKAARAQAPPVGAGAGAAYPEEEPGAFTGFPPPAAEQSSDALAAGGGSRGRSSSAAGGGPAAGIIATVKAACAAYDRAVKANPVLTKVTEIWLPCWNLCWPADQRLSAPICCADRHGCSCRVTYQANACT